MQSSVIDLYDRIREAPDENVRARIIAEAFEQVERRYPAMTDLVTTAALRASELRLLKEIEQLRGEVKRDIEQLRGDVKRDIEQLRGEVKTEIEQLRGDVKTEIEQLRGEVKREIEQLRGESRVQIEQLRTDIYRSRFSVVKWTAGLLLAQLALILTAMRVFFAA